MGLTRRAVSLLPLAGALALSASAVRAQPAAAPEASLFFEEPLFSGAVLSPDGRRVAYRLRVKEAPSSLMVTELDTMATKALASFDGVGIGHLDWVSNERIVFNLAAWQLPGEERDINPGLFAVNVDGSRYVPLVETRGSFFKNADAKRLLPQWTYLLQPSAGRDSANVWVVVIEHYDKKVGVDYMRLHRLDTLTGRSEEQDLPSHAVHWVIDANDRVRALLLRHEGVSSLLYRDAGATTWRTLAQFDGLQRHLLPRRVDADGTLWVQTADRGNTVGVYAWDFEAQGVSGRALAVSTSYDLSPEFVERHGQLIGLRVTTDAHVTQWLDTGMKTLQDAIDRALAGAVNELSVASHGDSPFVLVHSFSDVQPGSTLVFHRDTRKFTRVGDARPALRGKSMGTMDMVRIPARDGLSLPAYLTLPPGDVRKNLPMVLLVHGGPWVRGMSWHWDPEVQFLATRGYAVLQVEFRGSTGFGTRHFKAGWKQWGLAMQDDLTDATRWAVAQGIADAGRIAIMGASYGGYATLMGLVKEPQLYRCGVQWVGVTDPLLMYDVRWSDITDASKTYGMPRLLGDREKDADMLASVSPLRLADRIKAPLLMAYGGRDVRVPIVHGEKLRDALAGHNPQVQWVVYPLQGHGWVGLETQLDFWSRIEAFLARHLARA